MNFSVYWNVSCLKVGSKHLLQNILNSLDIMWFDLSVFLSTTRSYWSWCSDLNCLLLGNAAVQSNLLPARNGFYLQNLTLLLWNKFGFDIFPNFDIHVLGHLHCLFHQFKWSQTRRASLPRWEILPPSWMEWFLVVTCCALYFFLYLAKCCWAHNPDHRETISCINKKLRKTLRLHIYYC